VACGGQSASIPSSALRGPASATQAAASQPESLLTGVSTVPALARETVLHSFADGGDGAFPQADLLDVDGVLYGTTASGGTNHVGTVFKITASGTESVLYSFKGGSGDGAHPTAALIDVGGVLYGTTREGGTTHENGPTDGDGTVFAITTSGAESVLYRFKAGSDGFAPFTGLTDVGGVLYGTTLQGGAEDDGTVFKITTSGTESVVYSFVTGRGSEPLGDLTNVNGVLYGTTGGGDSNNSGTVFKITTSGTQTVLHRFKGGGNDGAGPQGALADVDGVLYGTTYEGGADGCGTVFKITTSGSENVLHSFGCGTDGKEPLAPLTYANGALYGTTYLGGVDYKGTIFSITTSGLKSAVYRFLGGSDGSMPYGGLTYVNGLLYGTTLRGGANDKGTVFSLSL